MLKTMKKEMEERELKWEQQQRIREEFVEATSRRKEQNIIILSFVNIIFNNYF